VRHGLAHQYQQLLVSLKGGKNFFISLTGANYGRFLNQATKRARPLNHLRFQFDSDGDLGLVVHTDILFLDFKHALDKSGLLTRNPSSLI